ncbi:MAG: GNAT family N-acetyltransferase, partial [Allosphingosinicella sp.]
MFVRTERLLLRPGWSQDAPALFEAIGDERIVRNLATAPWPYRPDDAEAWLATERKASEPSLLIHRHTGAAPELIGAIGFGRRPSGEMEFGYWIARAHWGRGYATEAGRAVLEAARHSLRL